MTKHLRSKHKGMIIRFLLGTLLSFCVAITTSVSAVIAAPQAEKQVLDRIIVVVNGGIILLSELQAEIRTQTLRAEERNQRIPPPKRFEKQVLEHLINQLLQRQAATKRGIRVSDDLLNRSLEDMAKRNRQSLDTFQQTLADNGYNYLSFRETIRTEIAISQVRRQLIDSKMSVSDEETKDFLARETNGQKKLESYHLFHFLLKIPAGATSEEIGRIKQKAEQYVEQLRGGVDFSSFALANSEGINALKGGDLGWRKAEQVSSLFMAAVRSMAVGGISDPIQSPNGFHILHVKDKKGEKKILVEQTKARHILLKVTAVRDEAMTQQKLLELRDQIDDGASFAELARTHSEDTASALDGGDLPWFGPGKMVQAFETVANSLEIHELSPVFRSQFGWHLMEVLGRRKQDDTENQQFLRVKRALRKKKIEEETAIWLRQLRGEAFIEYRLDEPV